MLDIQQVIWEMVFLGRSDVTVLTIKPTKTKRNIKNFNMHVLARVCSDCVPLGYTTQHTAALIISPLILQSTLNGRQMDEEVVCLHKTQNQFPCCRNLTSTVLPETTKLQQVSVENQYIVYLSYEILFFTPGVL